MSNYTTANIYDIAAAFITDRKTKFTATSNPEYISYTFVKRGLDVNPYSINVYAPRSTEQKRGRISLHHIINGEPKLLLQKQTRFNVDRALDNKHSQVTELLTRCMSPKFFIIFDMAEKRFCNELELQDNTNMLFNMLYRAKENQK